MKEQITDKRLRDTAFPHRHTTQIISHRSPDNTGQRRNSSKYFRFVRNVSKKLLKNVWTDVVT